jgi:hypothetical protein
MELSDFNKSCKHCITQKSNYEFYRSISNPETRCFNCGNVVFLNFDICERKKYNPDCLTIATRSIKFGEGVAPERFCVNCSKDMVSVDW